MNTGQITSPTPAHVPVHPGLPIIGALNDLRRDYLGTLLRATETVGDIARIDAGPPGWRASFYVVSSPNAVLHILGQPDLYTKDTPAYREVRTALGDGMLTSQGDAWRRQRRLMAPIFTARRITTSYAAIMIEEAEQLVDRWRSAAESGDTVDAHAEMIGVTSRVIGRILFGADMSEAIPRIMKVAFVNEALLRRGITPHAMPMWLPTPGNRRLSRGLAEIRSVVTDIVTDRRARPDLPGTDLLGLLLRARDDEGSGDRLSDQEVADQVLIFLLAGHETTATTLACSLSELARNPLWQNKVQDELRDTLGGRSPAAEDVAALPWTGRVIKESMRLYPSAHSIGRFAARDDVLCGYHIPAGSSVVISPWAVHRSAKVWSDPTVFDPRRFDVPEGQFPGGHRYAWFPFGAGPHTCVGMQLALLESTVVLATILQSFRLETVMDHTPLTAAVTLRPSAALPLRLHQTNS